MACNPEVLKQVPLFALLDAEETAVLAGQVELKKFAPRERIWKIGDPGGQAYVMVSGAVRVTTVDEDHQEVVVDEPRPPRLPSRKPSVSKWTAMILPFCCNANRWPAWTC